MKYTTRRLGDLNGISWALMVAYVSAIAILVTTAKTGIAANAHPPAELNASQQQYTPFFPFHDFLVLTVKSVHQAEEGKGFCVVVTAYVSEVVRGDCKKGFSTFAIRGRREELKFTRVKLEKLKGQQTVIAF